jgi:hypothetical protein
VVRPWLCSVLRSRTGTCEATATTSRVRHNGFRLFNRIAIAVDHGLDVGLGHPPLAADAGLTPEAPIASSRLPLLRSK